MAEGPRREKRLDKVREFLRDEEARRLMLDIIRLISDSLRGKRVEL